MKHRIFRVAMLVALILPAAGAFAQDDLTAKVQSGWAALQKGDLKAARASFQEVIDASPVYDFGWYALGQVATREGKLDEAVTDFNKAIEINADKFEYHYGLAAALRTKEDYAKAIAQQLAKNLYLSPSRNPYRKVRELFITRRLEAELSKRRIFELYLNLIEWGDGIWGAEAASRTYFGIPAADLDPSQAALMAGAIINPRIYSPAHPNARLLRRQQIILGRMGS